MDANGFRRCDGFAGSIPQNFINKNLPTCPLCGTGNPYWTLKDKFELTAHRILFRCQCCGGVLSATQDDFSGATKSAAYMLTTAGLVNAVSKKKQGKDRETVYLRVEDVGNCQTSSVLMGQDLPLQEYQRMAAAFYASPAPAPALTPDVTPLADEQINVTYGAPAQPVSEPAPAAEEPINVTYGAPAQPQYAPPQPAYAQPQPQYAQPQPAYAQPQYAAPQPQPVYAQPQYAQPQYVQSQYAQPAQPMFKAPRFPVVSLILLCAAFLGFILDCFVVTPYVDMDAGFKVLGFCIIIVGLCLYKKNMAFLCGIGVFSFAVVNLFYLYENAVELMEWPYALNVYFVVDSLICALCFVLIGLSFCLPTVKGLKVLRIVSCGVLIAVELVWIFVAITCLMPLELSMVLYLVYVSMFYISLMIYSPVKNPTC